MQPLGSREEVVVVYLACNPLDAVAQNGFLRFSRNRVVSRVESYPVVFSYVRTYNIVCRFLLGRVRQIVRCNYYVVDGSPIVLQPLAIRLVAMIICAIV